MAIFWNMIIARVVEFPFSEQCTYIYSIPKFKDTRGPEALRCQCSSVPGSLFL